MATNTASALHPLLNLASDPMMTPDEVAAWLKVKPRQVQRLGVPCVDFGRKTKRYRVADVRAWLEAKRAA